MRFILVIVVCISLCFQCFVQLGVVGWYKMNTSAITAKYCENKDKPQLQCNGKCHLKKQLNKTTDKESKNSNSSSQLEWAVFIIPEQQNNFAHYLDEVAVVHYLKQQDYSFLFLHTVFHPPQTV